MQLSTGQHTVAGHLEFAPGVTSHEAGIEHQKAAVEDDPFGRDNRLPPLSRLAHLSLPSLGDRSVDQPTYPAWWLQLQVSAWLSTGPTLYSSGHILAVATAVVEMSAM